jgi:hypothetical protein
VARRAAAVEAALAGVGGAALGGLVLYPLGYPLAGAAVAGVNGGLAGWYGIYDWRRGSGWAAAVLDSTWNLIGTTGALVVRAFGLRRADTGYVREMSRRQNRYVYRAGWTPRRRFAFTVGNTITNARNIEDDARRSLIVRHEGLHVWQQRWFGPLFPLVYGVWMVGGAITGSITWLVRGRAQAWSVIVERHAYYYNPFERWAYTADHDWPPPRMTRLMQVRR